MRERPERRGASWRAVVREQRAHVGAREVAALMGRQWAANALSLSWAGPWRWRQADATKRLALAVMMLLYHPSRGCCPLLGPCRGTKGPWQRAPGMAPPSLSLLGDQPNLQRREFALPSCLVPPLIASKLFSETRCPIRAAFHQSPDAVSTNLSAHHSG